MEKVKYITKQTRIVTCIRHADEKNYELYTWVAKDDDEAIALVKEIIDFIKTNREPMKVEWFNRKSTARLFFVDENGVCDERRVTWDFHITSNRTLRAGYSPF